MIDPRPRPQDHYITSPVQAPVLAHWIEYLPNKFMRTSDALPIARGVLMAAFDALKEQIPSGKRTIYNLERACYHLKRVKIQPTDHVNPPGPLTTIDQRPLAKEPPETLDSPG